MAGTFTVGEKKDRPGVYHRYENVGGVSIAGAINGIGAGTIRANWGPLNKVVEFEPSTKVSTIYGGGTAEYSGWEWWPVEPDVGRVAHGIPSRVDRLKCLGNAVVSAQFFPIFQAIYRVFYEEAHDRHDE